MDQPHEGDAIVEEVLLGVARDLLAAVTDVQHGVPFIVATQIDDARDVFSEKAELLLAAAQCFLSPASFADFATQSLICLDEFGGPLRHEFLELIATAADRLFGPLALGHLLLDLGLGGDQLFAHSIERVGEVADFVGAWDRHPLAQIAAADSFHAGGQRVDGRGEPTAEQPSQSECDSGGRSKGQECHPQEARFPLKDVVGVNVDAEHAGPFALAVEDRRVSGQPRSPLVALYATRCEGTLERVVLRQENRVGPFVPLAHVSHDLFWGGIGDKGHGAVGMTTQGIHEAIPADLLDALQRTADAQIRFAGLLGRVGQAGVRVAVDLKRCHADGLAQTGAHVLIHLVAHGHVQRERQHSRHDDGQGDRPGDQFLLQRQVSMSRHVPAILNCRPAPDAVQRIHLGADTRLRAPAGRRGRSASVFGGASQPIYGIDRSLFAIIGIHARFCRGLPGRRRGDSTDAGRLAARPVQ